MKQIVQELFKNHGWKIIAFILLLVAVKYANLEPKMVMDFLNNKSVIQNDSTN
jgi:F0F1-type ATP synthase membrane subunit b/b'